MCDQHCIEFILASLPEVKGLRILEVGAYDVNGSVRPTLEQREPSTYTGVDLRAGPRVDEVCDVGDLISRFGPDAIDVVVTTEMLEHVKDWRRAIQNLKGVLGPGGRIALTTRCIGFPYHEYPSDFWRYEPEDLAVIFRDFRDVSIASLPNCGVGLLGTKPTEGWQPADLSEIELYAVSAG